VEFSTARWGTVLTLEWTPGLTLAPFLEQAQVMKAIEIPASGSMSIGALARAAGVSIDTIRFYEKTGLLPPPNRTPSGYRKYLPDDLKRLKFIRRARDLGFSLDEIASLLALRTPGRRGVARVRAVAQRKLELVQQKIEELERLRAVLAGLVSACPGEGDPEHCPILRAFEADPDETQARAFRSSTS